MLYKDMKPVSGSELTAEQMKLENRPQFKPISSVLGSQITIEGAEGIPLPKDSAEFSRKNIVKRIVRVGLFDVNNRELIFNCAHVIADWNQANEDVWQFMPASKAESLNPLLFRTTAIDDLNRAEVNFIFEFVCYIR